MTAPFRRRRDGRYAVRLDPAVRAVLVGLHVLGASLVWSTALWFHHGLSDHRPEAGPGDGPGPGPAEDAVAPPSEVGDPTGPGPGAVVEPV